MTTNVTSKLESLLKTMSEGEEYARHGFDLLAKRPDPERYFDALAGAGFFDPSRNPGPVPSTEPGFVQIPFWTALNYLEVVAKRSGELDDLELANKVLAVVRDVSNFREPDGAIRDNHYTYWKFAEILALVPVRAITTADINLVSSWIISKFDRGLVGHTLGATVLSRLLASNDPSDIDKACLLMKQCITFQRLDNDKRGTQIATAIDDYWLKEILTKNAKLLGAKAGSRAAIIFANGLRAILTDERPYGSTLWRPAIEENAQNLDFRRPENRFVEGLREVLLGWMDVDPETASLFIKDALHDDLEIIRRIAIHMITERFESLRAIFEAAISPGLFVAGHRHELYRLLKERFSGLSANGKTAVLNALRALPLPSKGDEPEIRLKRTQREWLTAIKDHKEANTWFGELSADPSLGPLPDHPDFLSYHESRWGPGPTPFGAESLIAFAEDGTIVDRLNDFKETDSWKGPTLGGLISALEGAVAASPNTFLPLLTSFHGAKLPFQHALLNGFKRVLDTSNDPKPEFNWNHAWPKLITFFSDCLSDEAFWTHAPEENINLIPNRGWMISLIASFLEAGTKNDETAYSPDLLPQGWIIITSLLARVAPEEKSDLSDPMTRALNTEKGRLLGAMFNHALRVCRIARQNEKPVAEAWASVRDAFDSEIAKCRDANFDFSTLAAAYIANIDFMSRDWLVANVNRIFPIDYPVNFKAALGGLAYATPTRPIYKLLSDNGVFENALNQELLESYSRERVIQWISLAYLWGDEALESSLFSRIFEFGSEDLQTAAKFFWSVRRDKLTDAQVERVVAFWSRSIAWSNSQKPTPVALLSRLGRLSPYLKTLDGRAKGLMLAVVPYVHLDYAADQMVEELARLVDTNPSATAHILERMLEANTPNYDLDDKLKRLIQKLATLGLHAEAIRCAEKLRKSLPGMLEFYKSLLSGWTTAPAD